MGGHPYWYFVPYGGDAGQALEALREREFRAGRYSPVLRYIKFDEPAFTAQQPGPQHESIEEAMEAGLEKGTRSILDIERVVDDPDDADYGVAAPLALEQLLEIYGTDRPTRRMLEADRGYFDDILRGQCIYVVVHDDEGMPSELLFAGYSYD